MPGAFEAAAATLFADPNLSVAAIYTAPTQQPQNVRVIRRDLDVEGDVGGAPTRSIGTTFEMLRSAVPQRPVQNCKLEIGSETWNVFDVQQNVRKGTWIMFAEEL